MTPVTQTKVVVKNSKGETIIHGNCYPAIIATMLNLPITEVPNTEVFFDTSFDYKWLMNAWMREKFKMKVEWAEEYEIFHLEFEEGCRTDKEANDKRIDLSGDEYLAYGQSPRGVSHICVYQQGELVHDPHPTREGLVTIEGFMKIVPLVEGESTFANPDIQSRIYELSKENAKLKAELAAAPPAPIEETEIEINMDKRTTLRKLLFDFIENGAQYNDSERDQVCSLLQVLQPACEYFEHYNSTHPGHGVYPNASCLPPRYPRNVLEMDMYGIVIKTSEAPPSPAKMKEQLVQGDTLIRDATEIEKFLEKELSAACKRIEEQPHEILDRLYQELLAAKLLTPEAKKIWRRHMNAYTKSNT